MAILSSTGITGFLSSAKATGNKILTKAGELIPEYMVDFASGFAGHGWKIWDYGKKNEVGDEDKNKSKWKLEIDSIVVRDTMTVFELLIQKIRSVKGALNISQASGKIKTAELKEDGNWYITIEDEMSFMPHDIVRCQTWKNSTLKGYWVEISEVRRIEGIDTVIIPASEFTGNIESDEDHLEYVKPSISSMSTPEVGDEIIQFGNSELPTRQSAIYLHADEGGQPAIDVLFDINSKSFAGCLKMRLGGDIPGGNGAKGFYCENGMIRCVAGNDIIYQLSPDGSFNLGKDSIKYNPETNKLVFGSNVKLTWDNIDEDAKENMKGDEGASIHVQYSADAIAWHEAFMKDDLYMRQRIGTVGEWTQAYRIVGESGKPGTDGRYTEFQFAKSASETVAPVEGWQDAPPSVSGSEYLWMRSGEVTPPATLPQTWTAVRIGGIKGDDGASISVQYSVDANNWHAAFTEGDLYMRQRIGSGEWTQAYRIVGESGLPGADGRYTDYQFAVNDSLTDAPVEGWQDAPPSVSESEYLWMRSGEVIPPATVPQIWTAVRIGGVKGDAGASIGVQYSVDANNWHAAFTKGDLFMRQRIGSGDWTPAYRIVGESGIPGTDGRYTDFQFAVNDSLTDAPVEGWQDAPPSVLDSEYLWMRSGEVIPPATEPELWTAVRIGGIKGDKGEDGSHMVYIYMTSATQPPIPSGNGIPPYGWSLSPTSPGFNSFVWMSQASISGTGSIGMWSFPVRISGLNGENGTDGTDFEFIYKRTITHTAPDKPKTSQSNDFVPDGWSDNPQGVSSTTLYEWVCVRNKTNKIWSEFSNPVVWSKWGEKGMDGDGYEYIYKRTTTSTPPDQPTEVSQDDDYIPNGWIDDPAGVSSTYAYEWVCTRKKTNGLWSGFSSPALWAKLGKDGSDANLLPWLETWNGYVNDYGAEYMATPKMFSGSKDGDKLTGIAQGKDCITVNGVKKTGIYGLKDGNITFSLDADTGDVYTTGDVVTNAIMATGLNIQDKFVIDLDENGQANVSMKGKLETAAQGTRVVIDPTYNASQGMYPGVTIYDDEGGVVSTFNASKVASIDDIYGDTNEQWHEIQSLDWSESASSLEKGEIIHGTLLSFNSEHSGIIRVPRMSILTNILTYDPVYKPGIRPMLSLEVSLRANGVLLGSCGAPLYADGTGGGKTIETNIQNISVMKGTNRITYTIAYSIPAITAGRIALSSRITPIGELSFISNIYMSRYFANGFALGSSTQNFFECLNVNNSMLVRGVMDNYGLNMTNKGLQLKINGKWYTLSISGDKINATEASLLD